MGNFSKRGKMKAAKRQGVRQRPPGAPGPALQVEMAKTELDTLKVGMANLRREHAEKLAAVAVRLHGAAGSPGVVHAVSLGVGAAVLGLVEALAAFVPDRTQPPDWYKSLLAMANPPPPVEKTGPVSDRQELLDRAAAVGIEIAGGP